MKTKFHLKGFHNLQKIEGKQRKLELASYKTKNNHLKWL
jgi:hypothetical protein